MKRIRRTHPNSDSPWRPIQLHMLVWNLYILLHEKKKTNDETFIGTYRAFNRTRWLSKHEVSWKNIFLPFAGRFCAAITSSRNSIVWAVSLSALFLCRKHFLPFDVPSNDHMLIVTIRINMITVNDKSTRNRKFCRKKYFVRLVRRNILLKIYHLNGIFQLLNGMSCYV